MEHVLRLDIEELKTRIEELENTLAVYADESNWNKETDENGGEHGYWKNVFKHKEDGFDEAKDILKLK